MSIPITAERRITRLDQYKKRRTAYRLQAYELLGGRCSLCGSTENLRHRFFDPTHPLANRYRTNPGTLYRRILREPTLKSDLYLLCRECRIAHRSPTPAQATSGTPGPKTLPISRIEGSNDAGQN